MRRFPLFAVPTLVFGLLTGSLRAEEVRGKVKSVDANEKTLTVTTDATDKVYPVSRDARFVGLVGKKIKKATTTDLAGGLRDVKEGADVVLTTETRDGKAEVTQVKVETLQAPKKKKKAK